MMYAGVAAVWIVLMLKAPAMRRGLRDRGRRTYWLAIFFLGVCLTADRTPVYLALSDISGVPNIAHGVSYGAAIVGGWLGQLFLLYSYDRARLERQIVWRRVALAVGLGLYVALFFAGPAMLPTDPDVPHFAATGPGTVGFRLVLAAMVCWSMTEISWLAWHFSGLAAYRPLRSGMRIVAIGTAIVSVRVFIEYGLLPVWSASRSYTPSWSYDGSLYDLNLVAMGGAALMALGTAVPAVGHWRDARATTARYEAACTALTPLWEALRAVTPALSNVERADRPRRPIRRISALDRLYRTVAEIRDGYVVLWPYCEHEVGEELRERGATAGLDGSDLAAFVDAGSLSAGIAARRRGQRAQRETSFKGAPEDASFEAELAYLLRVADHWTDVRHAALVDGLIARPARQ